MLSKLIKSALERQVDNRIARAMSLPKEFGDVKAIEHMAREIERLASDRGFTEQQRYELFYSINRTLLPKFVINDMGRYILDDAEFRSYFERFSGDNWKSYERRWNLRELLRLLDSVDGDLAECGVFEGGNAYQLCQFAQCHGRAVHLFDSFEGLSAPTGNDGEFWKKGDLTASEAVVKANLEGFDCYRTFRGWIPEAFPQVAERTYAFLHIDVDLEQPTFDSIAFFYPRMNRGGIILLDDHGYDTCPGARKAVLDFMKDKPEPVLDLSSGQGLIIKR